MELQVPDTATGAEIRTAYRRLVKQLHPDVNRSPGAAAALQVEHASDTWNFVGWRIEGGKGRIF